MSTEVAKLYIEFDADGRPYIQGLNQIERQSNAFMRGQEGAWGRAGQRMGNALKVALVAGATAALAATIKITSSIVKTAAAYEYEMSRIKAVTNATSEEMETMRKVALQLGKDTEFTAGEAAQGMTELAKAGIEVSEILGGGIQGTLSLAAAGELEVARAAEIASNAMNVFGLKGEDVNHVADLLASAANKSSLEVEDLANALQYIGPVAAQLHMPIETVVAAIAELAQVGIKGDMAGTGLRGMLNSLISPSSTARQAMADLNVELADAQGNIKPMGEILDEFREGLEGLTEQEKLDKLGRIFDTHQLGVAMQLIADGSEGLEEWTEKVDDAGSAQRVAETKMDNFRGSLEKLKGSIETLAVEAGTPLIGWLRDVVDWFTEAVNWVSDFYSGLSGLEGWEGADITGKIKIAWDELNRQFREWFEGTSALKMNPWSDLQYNGTTGKEQLRRWGEEVGRAISDALIGFIGGTVDADNSVWVEAGKAIARGLYEGLGDFWNYLWQESFGQNPPDSGTYRKSLVGRIQNEGFWGGAYGWLQDVLGDPLQLGEEHGEQYVDGWQGGASPLTQVTEQAIADVDSLTPGRRAGGGFFEGFTAEFRSRFAQWNFNPVSFFRQMGSATGGGLTDAELMSMFGLGTGPGNTAGLKPQTSAFWGALHSAFPFASLISGYRPNDPYPDHPSGTAIDITVPGMQKSLADAVARWAINSGMARYVIWNYQTWWPGGGRTTYSHNDEDPHTSHLHIRTYHEGGKVIGGPSEVLIHAQAGERVLSEQQWELFHSFVAEIGKLADETREVHQDQQEFYEAFLAALEQRLDKLLGYVSREAARYEMQRAEFAPGGFDASEMAAMVGTLSYEIEHLNMAVAEAEAQLNEAKWMQLPQEEINALAESLFNLRSQAADARRELEELERLPLEQALDRWSNAVDNLSALMNVLSYSSDALALQMDLLPNLLGAMGASYQTNLDLMNQSVLPSDIMSYGQAAISDLTSMFSTERSVLDRGLDDTLDSISDSQEAWEDAWQARYEALQDSVESQIEALQEQAERQREALREQLEDLDRAHREELEALEKFYDDKLLLLSDREREITREQQRNQMVRTLGTLEDELRILQGQGYYTEADIARMRELEDQIQQQHDEMQQQEDAWAREDERLALEREREAALKALQQQQEMERQALEDQIEAALKALEAQMEAQRQALQAQLEAMEKEREAQLRHFEELRKQARQAYQDELDALVAKYAEMMNQVMAAQQALLGESGDYYNAGYTLGKSFADGLRAAIESEIIPAAQAAAQAVADYLQLSSPAKLGPLSRLNHWWDEFAHTLTLPLIEQDFMRPVMDTAMPGRDNEVGTHRFFTGEEHLYIHLDGHAEGVDLDALADVLSHKLGHRIEVATWSM